MRSKVQAVRGVDGVLLAAVLCLVPNLGTAQHAGHHHPAEHAQTHEQFYSNWFRPDDRRFSCCNKKDCEPVEARIIGGHWHVLRPADQRWLRVPPSQVETERDSPDGRNHACFQPPGTGDTVYCFLAAAGG